MPRCEHCKLPIETDGQQTQCDPCLTLAAQDPPIRLRPLSRSDLELVLAWRSHPDIYQHFRIQDGPIEWDEHVAWFNSQPTGRYDFIIHYDGRRVGVVSLNTNNEVGIYIGDFSARGHGVATGTLNWLCERFASRTLYAEIHEQNSASQRVFGRCGFRQRRTDGEWLYYQYQPDSSDGSSEPH